MYTWRISSMWAKELMYATKQVLLIVMMFRAALAWQTQL
jgi:hypothetical protein